MVTVGMGVGVTVDGRMFEEGVADNKAVGLAEVEEAFTGRVARAIVAVGTQLTFEVSS